MKPTESQIEALKELINIGVGKGASVLNTMLNSHIVLQVPMLQFLSISNLQKELNIMGQGKLSTVTLKFDGRFSGSAELVFPSDTAMALVNSLVEEEDIMDMGIDAIIAGTLCEVGNVVLNGLMGSISNLLSSHFDYSVPEYSEDTADNIIRGHMEDATVMLAKTRFIIQEMDITGDIVLFFDIDALNKMMEMIEEL